MSSAATPNAATRQDQVDYVSHHLLGTSSLLVRLLVKQVRLGDISRTEGEVLGTLSGGPRRITELAEMEGLAQPTMTLLIKRLERSGWVRRQSVPEDGRVVVAEITTEGRDVVAGFRARFAEAIRDDLACLSASDLGALARATRSLEGFVEKLQCNGP